MATEPFPFPDEDVVEFYREWRTTCVTLSRWDATRALYNAPAASRQKAIEPIRGII